MKNDISWPLDQAEQVIKNLKPGQDSVIFETGYGPSGLPHFGTFAEVARTSFIIKALLEKRPDLKIRLIAFSDDSDGLRKLPPNIPNHEMLSQHLGKPITKIPDPFNEKTSFADYMNSKFKSFLDQFGFEYEYISSAEFYAAGKLDAVLKQITDKYDEIRDVFIETIAKEKRAAWSQFMPICPSCGLIYSTRVTAVHKANYSLDFICDKESEFFKPCGYKGSCEINGQNLKLGWKIDWAARWIALKVDFEAHGEDLMESVRMSKRICKILGEKGPITYKYELFLDENGIKISKTKGNGLNMEQWLDYSPLHGLLYFLTSEPNRSNKMGMANLPKLVDEYLAAERGLDGELTPNNRLWYVNKLVKSKLDRPQDFISYQLLVNIVESLNIYDPELVLEYANRYQENLGNNQDFKAYIKQIISYVKGLAAKAEPEVITPDQSLMPYLEQWLSYLKLVTPAEFTADAAQTKLFSIAKSAEVELKAWFKFLYNVYFHKNEGPKLGHYFVLIGHDKALELTSNIINAAK